jgi:hypothetical protein
LVKKWFQVGAIRLDKHQMYLESHTNRELDKIRNNKSSRVGRAVVLRRPFRWYPICGKESDC